MGSPVSRSISTPNTCNCQVLINAGSRLQAVLSIFFGILYTTELQKQYFSQKVSNKEKTVKGCSMHRKARHEIEIIP